ncbi:MAG: imidazolonepropionase, partial [Bacteroidia bacterium]|nr:imidazolonepropionase [Bacteroidia bacterium]
GTGAVEIKSGYGLTVKDEIKMLRVIQKLKALTPLAIKATFLGAHAIPSGMTKEKYVEIVVNEMLPQVAEEKLAEYCDVFCERNYFSKEDSIKILSAARNLGLKGKVHAEQLSNSGGVKAGVECGAISVDHLEFINDEDITVLKNSNTMPTILPGAQWFLQLPYPPVRKIIDAGLPLAIASDYNPGSSPSGNISMMISMSCIQYKMTPEEAINAATINSAYAMDLSETHGSITEGKQANVFITNEISDYSFLPYSFANNLIQTTIINGKICSN